MAFDASCDDMPAAVNAFATASQSWQDKGVVPFATEAIDYEQIVILCARRLSDGNFALGSDVDVLGTV